VNWRFKIGIYPWRIFNQAELLQSGTPFFEELINSIHSSKLEIQFQAYIFEWDVTGKRIWQALEEAAQRGVSVNLYLDAYGSSSLLSKIKKNKTPPNFRIQFYSPFRLLSKQPIGMRLHHKIMVFDRQIALIGGINIANHYSGFDGSKPWLDYAIKLSGEIAKDLNRICLKTGNRFKKVRSEPIQSNASLNIGSNREENHIRVLENNWLKGKFGISKQYKVQTRRCKNELWIINSYFVPSNALLRLLKKAAYRNVSVNLILGGQSDVNLVKHASEYFYKDLLKAGINIYEYKASILHAKLAYADDNWMCIGSYNLNHLSDFGSIECNVEIRNEVVVKKCKTELLLNTLPYCNKIQANTFSHSNSHIRKLRNFLSFQLLRILLNLLFFFQKSNKKLNKET
jgi:cardiolipin synthase